MNNKTELSVIGLGNMGGAVINGIISSGLYQPDSITVFDRFSEKLDLFSSLGCHPASDEADAVKSSPAILIAVKPQNIKELLASIEPYADGRLFVSIAAGVKISTLESGLPGGRVIRVMPNTPLTVSSGVSVLARGLGVSDGDFSKVRAMFACAGVTAEADEELLDPVTALTSSSIAYFSRMLDCMCRWAENGNMEGMSHAEVVSLACESMIGAARLIKEKNMEPSDLTRAVTSPNGTTEEALRVFTEYGFDKMIPEAMDACVRRAKELSRS